MGNRFTITLRGIVAESEDVIKAAVDGLGKNGFINYYGLQRFGSGSVPTHLIGAALLRGEWKTAVNLVLDPREGERDDIKEVREHYKQHGDIDMALRNFPRHLVAERSILLCLRKSPDNYLQALKGIPRTLRMMYVHSYQSYLWNHAASMRVEKYGISQVIEGDLIYSKESRPEEATSVGTSEADDGHTNSSDLDISSEILPEENIQSVKIVDSEDLLKGIYSFEDVVLPLPGSQALFPGNEVAEIYHEIAKKDGISLTESAHGVKEFSITNMKGGYRRVFQKPIDFEWELMTYTDDSASLAETDLDLLSKDKLTDAKVANEPTSTGNSVSKTGDCKLEGPLQTSMPTSETSVVENKSIGSSDTLPSKLAVKLTFTLPASTYATMAIRELLKNSTSVSYQKTLDCKVLYGN